MVQLTVKIIGVGTFRIGEQSPTAGIQVADKESCQQRKRRPVIENLRAQDERKPLIERSSQLFQWTRSGSGKLDVFSPPVSLNVQRSTFPL